MAGQTQQVGRTQSIRITVPHDRGSAAPDGAPSTPRGADQESGVLRGPPPGAARTAIGVLRGPAPGRGPEHAQWARPRPPAQSVLTCCPDRFSSRCQRCRSVVNVCLYVLVCSHVCRSVVTVLGRILSNILWHHGLASFDCRMNGCLPTTSLAAVFF